MGRALLALLAVLLALPVRGGAAPAPRGGARAAEAKGSSRGAARAAKARPARATALVDAKAAMRALLRDPTRRRYRHHWEKAIAGLLRASRGPDAADGFLEAARARYALYRWSADEADRDKALLLAARATHHGSRDAPALAAAIRREAGDDRPARPAAAVATAKPARRPTPAPARRAPPEPTPAPEPAADEDSPPDPALEAALGDLGSAARPLPLGDSGGEGVATVSEVRTWSNADYTRVAVYLSHWVGWQKLELARQAGLPRRLALDLRPARLAGKALARGVAGARVDELRAAQHDPETVRVVLDLPGRDGVTLFSLDDPPRLIVDVGTHAARREAEARGPEAAAPEKPAAERAGDAGEARAGADEPAAGADTAGEQAAEEREPGPIRRIVVDAGHGGHDPGAIGPRRVREKDVTLAMAQRLARKLRAAGFEVVLTRQDDRFLALEERTAIANTARGDLFVSIHANAHPQRNRSGVETYFLNVADGRYAARLAARENGLGDEGAQAEATRILSDLDATSSAGASRRLARLVQREVCGGVRARVGEVRDLGVKSALFYVLLGARMPAVLVETAFVSNRVEEKRLASARYQDEVASGVSRAVAAFARADARVAAAR